MNFLKLAKQVKKKLKRNRRSISLAGWLLIAVAIAGLVWAFARPNVEPVSQSDDGQQAQALFHAEAAPDGAQGAPDEQALATSEAVRERLAEHPEEAYRVTLRTTYTCGEETKAMGLLDANAVMQAWAEHPEWTADMPDEQSIVLEHRVNDLSPKCKETGYIGIDQNGNLSLFDGKPQNDKVIRTFFQLNIKYLETSLPPDTVKQLYAGIKVNDLDEYNSVLSTFSDFAVYARERL